MAVNHQDVQGAALALANPEKAASLARYFKTEPGQYGEGDQFLGITVPRVRQLATQFRALTLADCQRLLQSPYNEERLLALLVLVQRYTKGDPATQQQVFELYLQQRARVNNWNLVDSSAPLIVGAHLLQRDRALLYNLIQSPSLWDRRIAVLATFAFIRGRDFSGTLALAERSLADPHDLMHKACGWMLREVGKRDQPVMETFLRRHHAEMPRTMLRYAIEKLAPALRRGYLAGCPIA
ncbi:MAG: DNA alkylation repair protein [Rhodoferax sp.]|nr:DNA alkylation repair protein [Rhodoferax sp.]